MTQVEWTSSAAVSGFGSFTDTDEYVHGTGPQGDSLTETWFWGFSVPEQSINCYLYCWVHPNLDVVSVGLLIYQGITAHHLAAELFDFPAFLKASTVVGDGHRIEVPNGLTVTVLDPLRHVHIGYHDLTRDTVLDVHLNAVSEPIMRANGLHFEQVMHATGRLRLRGEEHTVDSHAVRDRSWSELRPEDHNPHGPYNWVTAVSGDGSLGFNVGSLDVEGMTPGQAFRDGWLWRDGMATRLNPPERTIVRDPATGRPVSYRMVFTDGAGHVIHADGEVVASVPWSGWHNMVAHLGLVRWTVDGVTLWGDSMDCQWNDQVRAFHRGVPSS
ncbi:hypothetical protein BOO86_06015 [Mycobacterium sp. CBMA 234]|uniref:DUF7064 domain-containing protein n=1 Tax=Mycolicibacterium sp. CBMA 234 TaxID=1918495 RepID=UPI0012DED030|nr:hypothetical protein [Mycolicibacterium sp. CBMA 234]MUL64014.1 hypothetical protein [Mycolicibacterium sp. CBMA 234]